MRRFATIALSLLLFGTWALAQDEKKADEPKAPADGKAAATAEKSVPPEVQAKIEAARKAVAEAMVAAEDAGLIRSSIDPPPILDLLVYGGADDEASVKGKEGVSPEVFGAWFAGYGRTSGVNYEKEVRIYQPSKGLKALYDKRAEVFRPLITAARKAKSEPSADEQARKDAEAKPRKDADEKKATEDQARKDAEVKKDEPKAEAKKDEPKADEPKPEEPKKTEEPKKADEPKAEEPKKTEEPKKAEEPKADEPQ